MEATIVNIDDRIRPGYYPAWVSNCCNTRLVAAAIVAMGIVLLGMA